MYNKLVVWYYDMVSETETRFTYELKDIEGMVTRGGFLVINFKDGSETRNKLIDIRLEFEE